MRKQHLESAYFWQRGPFVFGVALTAFVIFLGAFSLLQWPICQGVGPCKTNWDVLRYDSDPNEIGDMLAGFAGALAFIWIVVTVLLQASELREQREQFEKMADAQEEQVALLVKQGRIFENEQRQRVEVSGSMHLSQLLKSLERECKHGKSKHVGWHFSVDMDQQSYRPTGQIFRLLGYFPEDEPFEDNVANLSEHLEDCYGELISAAEEENNVFRDLPETSEEISELIEITGAISEVVESLSLADKERVRRLKIRPLLLRLCELQDNNLLWQSMNEINS